MGKLLFAGLLFAVSFLGAAQATPSISFLSDIDGQPRRLDSFLVHSRIVSKNAQRKLEIAAGEHYFVVGGNITDRGPASTSIASSILDLKKRDSHRVVILLGAREIQKMRLTTELSPHSLAHPSSEYSRWLRQNQYTAGTGITPPIKLRYLLSEKMQAPFAFEYKRKEIAQENPHLISDQSVAQNFLNDLNEGGISRELLKVGQLAAIIGDTLIVEGAITDENFGFIPGKNNRIRDVRKWVDALNEFARKEIGDWAKDPSRNGGEFPRTLVTYAETFPEIDFNQESVVAARYADSSGNPVLPSKTLINTLRKQGVRRILSGGSVGVGQLPLVMKHEDFEVVTTNTSNRADRESPSIFINEKGTQVAAFIQGRYLVQYSTQSPYVGFRTDDGYIIKAVIEGLNLAHLFRVYDKTKIEEVIRPLSEIDIAKLASPLPPTKCSRTAAELAKGLKGN